MHRMAQLMEFTTKQPMVHDARAGREVGRLLLKAGLNRRVVVYVKDIETARARHIRRQTLAHST